jgi:hypothetical protein
MYAFVPQSASATRILALGNASGRKSSMVSCHFVEHAVARRVFRASFRSICPVADRDPAVPFLKYPYRALTPGKVFWEKWQVGSV